jgi:hypothetical protein
MKDRFLVNVEDLKITMPVKLIDLKTYDYFLSTLTRMITAVYNGNMGGDFIDVMANLISGQLTQAFNQAWKDEENEGDLPDYLTGPLEEMILSEYDHVDGLYKDTVDARVDKTPIDPLLVRAAMWANRWTDAYNTAVALITKEQGGNMIWKLGETEQHCPECASLNGITARASEWDQLGVHPQQPPNEILTCGGWQCDCSLESTDKRRSPKAYNTIMNIIGK